MNEDMLRDLAEQDALINTRHPADALILEAARRSTIRQRIVEVLYYHDDADAAIIEKLVEILDNSCEMIADIA